jgi:hypothetical protein
MRSKRISRISSPPVAAGPALWRALARRRLAGRKPQAPEQDPRSRAHRRCSQAVDWRRACRRRQSASPGGYGFMLLDFRALRRASQSTSGSPHRSPKCRRRARSRRDDAHDTKPANVVGAVSTRFSNAAMSESHGSAVTQSEDRSPISSSGSALSRRRDTRPAPSGGPRSGRIPQRQDGANGGDASGIR